MRRIAVGVLCFIAVVGMSGRASAGKLSRARGETSGSSSSSSSSKSSSSSSSGNDDSSFSSDGDYSESNAEFEALIVRLMFFGLFIMPRELTNDNWERLSFYKYPYIGRRNGVMHKNKKIQKWGGAPPEFEPEPVKQTSPLSVYLQTHYQYDLDGVHCPSVDLLLEGRARLGLTSAWTTYIEPLKDNNIDSFTIGDLGLSLRFAQSRRAQYRVGIGGRLLLDGDYTSGGINIFYDMDFFPVSPLAISFRFDIGSIGKAFFARAQFHLGFIIRRFEPFLGYDFHTIGEVGFQGPMAGFRFWL